MKVISPTEINGERDMIVHKKINNPLGHKTEILIWHPSGQVPLLAELLGNISISDYFDHESVRKENGKWVVSIISRHGITALCREHDTYESALNAGSYFVSELNGLSGFGNIEL